jgi:hypothetical protein
MFLCLLPFQSPSFLLEMERGSDSDMKLVEGGPSLNLVCQFSASFAVLCHLPVALWNFSLFSDERSHDLESADG